MPPKQFMIIFDTRADTNRAATLLMLDGSIPFITDMKYYAIWTDHRNELVDFLHQHDMAEMEVIDMRIET